MDPRELKKKSKFLSLILRHDPGRIGLHLDEQGWARVDHLLEKARLTRAQLDQIVQNNDKKRFAFSEDGTRVRASQGHSVNIQLGLEPRQPPHVLYHGTADRNVASIFATGLNPRSRQHVHLSTCTRTATAVGSRHGRPAVLRVDAARMARDGLVFYLSDNGVWLTDLVDAAYLSRVQDEYTPRN